MAEEKNNSIPSSARVWESSVIAADKDTVFESVKKCTFPWSTSVVHKSTEIKGDANAVGGTRIIKYSDGTSQTLQILEISALSRTVTWSVIASEPAVEYTSATHQMTVKEVTNPSGKSKESFVEWTTDFSNDAKIGVIEDSRYKKKTAFKEMATFFAK